MQIEVGSRNCNVLLNKKIFLVFRNQKLLFIVFLVFIFTLGFSAKVDAATYYMRADGTVAAANKANATGCGSVGTALNITQHNAATFSDGDTIYLCSNGGDYTTTLIPPSSGTSVGITYRNVDGQTPVIDSAGTQTTGVSISGKSYITIQGLIIKGGTSNNITLSGTTNNITISGNTFSNLAGSSTKDIVLGAGNNVVITGNTFYQPLVSGYAFGNSTALSNLTFSNNILIGPGRSAGRTASYALYFYYVTNLIFSGNTINGWSMTGNNLVYFRNCISVNSSNNIIGSQANPNDGYGYVIITPSTSFISNGDIIQYQNASAWNISGGTGISLSNCQGSNSTGARSAVYRYGFEILNASISLNNCSASNNDTGGFKLDTSTVVSGTNITASYNGGNGFYLTATTASLDTLSSTHSTSDGFSVAGASVVTGTNLASDYNGSAGFLQSASANVSITGGHANNNVGYGYSSIGTGPISLSGITASSNSGGGFSFAGSSVVSGLNLVASSNTGSNGFSISGSANVTLTGGQANNSGEDGYNISGSGSMTIYRASSYNNGSVSSPSSGDGYTGHDTATVKLYDCLAYNNFKSGYASGSGHTGGKGSEIYNCTFYNNYDVSKAGTGGGIDIPSAGKWKIKNNITFGHDREIRIGVATGGIYDISNNIHFGSLNATPFNWNGNSYNWADWTNHSATGCGGGSCSVGSSNVNPLVISSSNFYLQPTSPAINAGTDVGLTTDHAGNPKSGPNFDIGAYEFQDSTAPTTTANVNTGLYNSAQNVTLTCDDGVGVGCDKIYYTTDGSDPTTSSTQYSTSISMPVNVVTTLKFFSQDKNGNTESYQTKIYTIDAVAPTGGSFTINSGSANTNSTTVTLNITCPTDAWTPVQVAYGNSSTPSNWTACAVSKSLTLNSGDGSKTVYVRFKDGGDNITSDLTQTINLDQTAPIITITNPDSTPAQTKTITATKSDGTLTMENTTGTTCNDTLTNFIPYADQTFTHEADNGIKICYKATDSVNNISYLMSEAISGIDTTPPTISNASPNNQVFPYTTTNINLTLTTSETSICKYATASGQDFSDMTVFATTNSTNHTTPITNLLPGKTYNYYIKCQSTILNISPETQLTFSTDALPANAPIKEKIKVKGKEIYQALGDTVNTAKKALSLKQIDSTLAKGVAKIYKNNKLWKTVHIGINGMWEKTLNLKKNITSWITITLFNHNGDQVSSQTSSITVDTQKPKFTKFIKLLFSISKGGRLYWEATDNIGIVRYEITFNKQTTTNTDAYFDIPTNIKNGTYSIQVKAFDAAGNSQSKKTWVRVGG